MPQEKKGVKSAISNFFAELFFPSFCIGCEREGTFLCYDCKSTLEISEFRYCLCNKNPLRIAPSDKNTTIAKCSRCRDKKLSGLYSALPYQEKWLTKKLLHQFKYPPYLKHLSVVLAVIIAEHLILTGSNTETLWQHSVLAPIPMGIKKMKERGYNQSEELAKELSRITQTPLALNSLIKIKETLPQTELSAKQREENVKNVFSIKNHAEIAGKNIFLVDDVYTTGSTMEACATVLKKYGAKRVWGVTIARDG